jgi:predicted permease
MLSRFRALLSRIRGLLSIRRLDSDFQQELESHLTLLTEENIRRGLSPSEARRAARLKLGNESQLRETHHDERTFLWLETLWQDVRYALRVLRKAPAFTVVALLTLMLGIGANVVVFGVLNAALLRPLDVSDPQNLYQLRPKLWMSGRLLTTSYPAFEDFQRRNTTFTAMAGMNAYSHAALTWRGTAIDVSGDKVTGNYFDMLGVQPEAGHFFHAADEHGPNSAPYVVLSDDLWRRAFDADRGIVGATVELSKHPFTVIGVAPSQFHGTERFTWPDYWIPIVDEGQAGESDYLSNRASRDVTVFGRLKPGVTPQQATENLNGVVAALAKEYPETDAAVPVRLIHPGLFGDEADVIRGFLYSVTVLALLVLAAACANLASLFAARVADRSRELALRVALGSSRWHLVRQLLTEAVIVSLMGGAAGLVTADLLLRGLNRWYPDFGGHLAISVDGRVYLAGLVLTLGCALLFGIIPARQAWHNSPLQVIKGGTMDSTLLRRFASRDLLLGAQIAICTLLVTASLVAVRGMMRELHAPIGFEPQGATLAEMDLGQVDQEGDVALEKEKEVLDATRSIPGVSAAGAVFPTPMNGWIRDIPIYQPGTVEFRMDNYALTTYVYMTSPGYLAASRTHLLAGRDLSWQDTANTPYVAIVNDTFARRMWGEAPAIGQRFILWNKLTEVVGVVENGKYHDLAESPLAAVFLPLSQSETSDVVFVVRSRLAANETAAALQRTLSSIEPNVPISLQTWPDALAGLLFPARAAAVALGVMGLLAAMLAATGIFGMAAYSVSRRTKELGIRVALGARKTHVLSAAVGRPMVLLGAGSVLGLLSGIFASRLLGQIVYQANPRDPLVVGGAVLTMALLGIAASAIPALRALAVDPSKLMREE